MELKTKNKNQKKKKQNKSETIYFTRYGITIWTRAINN